MTFHIEKSTNPAAMGAGAPPPRFIDYTHRLRFENAETGDQAEALATFGEGDELSEARQWAKAAHGLDLVAVEEFDAKAEHKRRKAEAEALADDLANAQNEAERIVAAAHQEAAKIRRDALSEADDIIAEAARVRAEAEAAAGDLTERQAEDTADGFGEPGEDPDADKAETGKNKKGRDK